MVKPGRQKRSDVEYPISIAEKTQEAVEAPAKKTEKKNTDEPYQHILEFPETGEISLFKRRNYKVSVLVGIGSSRMNPVICVFDIGSGPNLIRDDGLDQRSLDNVPQRDMPEI